MGGGERQIEEERAFGMRVPVDVVYCTGGQVGQTVLMAEIIAYGSRPPETGVLSGRYSSYLRGGGLAVLYILHIRCHVQRTAETVEIIES